MHKFTLLLWHFYKPLFIFNTAFTLCSLFMLFKNGLMVLHMAIALKLVGYITGIGYQYFTYNHQYYYYRNAGHAVRKLYALVYTFDFIMFTLLTTAYTLSTHAYTQS